NLDQQLGRVSRAVLRVSCVRVSAVFEVATVNVSRGDRRGTERFVWGCWLCVSFASSASDGPTPPAKRGRDPQGCSWVKVANATHWQPCSFLPQIPGFLSRPR